MAKKIRLRRSLGPGHSIGGVKGIGATWRKQTTNGNRSERAMIVNDERRVIMILERRWRW
jgi:hypothetical protein